MLIRVLSIQISNKVEFAPSYYEKKCSILFTFTCAYAQNLRFSLHVHLDLLKICDFLGTLELQ